MKSDNRECGACTACWEGWLVSDVVNMLPGKPCRHFTSEGCSIYEEHPGRPCRTFSCSWLTEDSPRLIVRVRIRWALSCLVWAVGGSGLFWRLPQLARVLTRPPLISSNHFVLRTTENNVAILFVE